MVNLEIKTLVVGRLFTNCYIAADKKTKQAFVLDPGAAPEKILSLLDPKLYTLIAILVTHCHFDHIGAVAQLKKKFNVPFLIPKGEEPVLALAKATSKIWTGQEIKVPPKPDGFLKEGCEVKIGKVKFKVISTPGHSPAGVSLYATQSPDFIGTAWQSRVPIKDRNLRDAKNFLFSGDTLFAGSIGRTDLPGGSDEEMKQSLKKLLKLPNETLVFPGHGERTTIGEEKRNNPFLQNLLKLSGHSE